jgi:hypothetical protein
MMVEILPIKLKLVIKRVIAVLNFPRNISKFIEYAGIIHNSMASSAVYSGSVAKLATLASDLASLGAAETACKTKPPTKTTADRNIVKRMVENDLRALRSDVQILADASPANAISIITDAGMQVKNESVHGKRKSTAKDGDVTGSVILEGEGAGPHEFQISTDNKTWTLLPASRTEKTVVLNLVPGTVYYFQNRQMLTKGLKTAWTESISHRVK